MTEKRKVSKKALKPKLSKAKQEPPSLATTTVNAPRNKGLVFLLVALVAAGLVAQSVWVFYRDRKAQVTLIFEQAIAPRGQGIGEVLGCRHMAVDAKGNLLYLQGVGDTSLLQKFSREGKLLARLGPESPSKDRLNNGFAIAGDPDGSVWVVERGPSSLKHYSAEFKLLKKVQIPNSDLTGVAVAPNGTVWACSVSGSIFSLLPGSTVAQAYQSQNKGRLISPLRLCFDSEGNFYILDFEKGSGQDSVIKVYSPKFEFLRSWTVKDQPANEFMCIAYHNAGYVVVNDTRGEVVDGKGFRLYTPKGKLAGLATLTNTGQNIRTIPGFAITSSGDWYLDMTPLQQGCGRLSWVPTL